MKSSVPSAAKGSAPQKPAKHSTKKQYNLESYKFAHYQPQAIECISSLTKDGKLIAISRANSNIEVWSKDSWA
jgi:hypothetical protein